MTRAQHWKTLYNVASALENDGRTLQAQLVREIMEEIRQLPGGIWGKRWGMWP